MILKKILTTLLVSLFLFDIINCRSLISRYGDDEETNPINEQKPPYDPSEYGMKLSYVILLTIIGGFLLSCAMICLCCTCILFCGILKASCTKNEYSEDIIKVEYDEDDYNDDEKIIRKR
uniref:Uncharacterized protein n=1 Tax=Parastrongyloides trichosuri TaxID=131310 RepID=A0A0N4Z3L2_PARTI